MKALVRTPTRLAPRVNAQLAKRNLQMVRGIEIAEVILYRESSVALVV